MAGADEAVNAGRAVLEQELHGRGDELVSGQQEKIFQSVGIGLLHGGQDGRDGGLKTDSQKNDFLAGIVAGDGQGLERGIDDLDPAALGLFL
ncbi:hypothetical protein ES705_43361 [subsurface metagenome]